MKIRALSSFMHSGSSRKAGDSSRLNKLQRLDKPNPDSLNLSVQQRILVKLQLFKDNMFHPTRAVPKSVHFKLSIYLFILQLPPLIFWRLAFLSSLSLELSHEIQ